MTPLTQYGRMAEKHWREHRPKMVRDLERKGLLHQMLLEAEEKTKDEMATLRMELMKQGKTAQQAQTQAWEMVREKYILLPPTRRMERQHRRIRKNRRKISTPTASPRLTAWARAGRN